MANLLVIGIFALLGAALGVHLNSRIVGGGTARAAEFPWQAAIYVDTFDGKFFCGGSLVSSQWVLTAAHCLYNGRMYTIHFGSNWLVAPDSNKVIVASLTHTIHPNFDPSTLENDIGLIKLHQPITLSDYIQPISLANIGDISEGSVAIASGWGQTNDSTAGLVNDLQYVNVAVISNVECSVTYGSQIKTSMICTLGNYNEGICTGDTGGPLIIEKGFNEYLQIGVGSFFSQLGCETTHPSGYTRVDLFASWIEETIADDAAKA